MKPAADMVCYVQPIVTKCEGVAWVDTSKTAVLRGTVDSASEGRALIAAAERFADALGGEMMVKIIVNTTPGAARAPAGVKRLRGVRMVATPQQSSAL